MIRLNVAITRAKRKIIMVGNAKTLRRNAIYNELINYVKTEGKFLNVDGNN